MAESVLACNALDLQEFGMDAQLCKHITQLVRLVQSSTFA